MQPFTYIYKNEIRHSQAKLYSDNGNLRYRMTLGNDFWLTIAPFGFPGPGNTIIWLQSNEPGEIIQPHDLIQELGEGIEALG